MTSRDDIFIIWGNGLQHFEEIIDIIRNEYTIFFIQKHAITNMEQFIHDVYKCDTVPWNHLIAKTRYLLKSPKICYTIYVENNKADERYYGEGQFRHIQCSSIKATKEVIRNKFNPRLGSSNRRSEEHVIHATDYSTQVEYLKLLFHIPEKSTRVIDYSKFVKHEINVNDLYCNILGRGIIPIRETPHFKYATGENKEAYQQYIHKHIGVELIHDHLPKAFDILIDNFDDAKSDGIIYRRDNSRCIIEDGVHRACILMRNGHSKIDGYIC